MADGQAVAYATVSIKGTFKGTVSDHAGNFQLGQLDEGYYTLHIQSVGFKPKEIGLLVQHEQNLTVDVELETDQIGLNEIVVTANRQETNRQEAPVIVNVIGSGLFDANSAVCMADGLNYQPGLRVENNCQNCGFQQVRINGLEGPYSQILIDSRPIFSALSGVYGIEQIPVAMIDRVEVVRGGGSALYGSNAIAGTINIITREPLKNGFDAAIQRSLIGNKTSDQNISLSGTLVSNDHKAGAGIFAIKRDRGQFDANSDGFSELGLIDGMALGARTYYRTSLRSKLTATYHFVDEFRRGGNKFDQVPHETDITEQTDHKIHGGEVVFDYFGKNQLNKLSMYMAAQYINRDSYYGAGQDENAYGHTTDLSFVTGTQFTTNTKSNFIGSPVLTTGAEYQTNSMHDKMPGYQRDLNQDIYIAGLYMQAEWKFKQTTLLLGARTDKHNLIKKAIISPRVNLLHSLTPDLQWRASFSTGFRAPQAFDEDLHIIAVNGGVMLIELDPNLRPEYSKSISSSFDYYYKIGLLEGNLMAEGFYTLLDDVFVLETLETDENGNMRVERRNGKGAVVRGINVENRTAISKSLQVQLGMTFQQSRYQEIEFWSENPDTEGLKALPKSPDVYGYLSLNYYPAKKLSTYLTATYTGSMKVLHFEGYIDQDRIETTPSFLDLNLKVAYELLRTGRYGLQLEAGVQNILNSYQKDFDQGMFRDAGYMYGPMKPRTYVVALKAGI